MKHIFILTLAVLLQACSHRPLTGIPLRVDTDKHRKDSLDCTLWTGIPLPLILTDKNIKHPLFKSKDVEIEYGNGLYFPRAYGGWKKVNPEVSVDLYDVRANDTIFIKKFNFVVKTMPIPKYYLYGKAIDNSVSRKELLKAKRFDMAFNCGLDTFLKWRLYSYDMEIGDKGFHSDSNNLTDSMIYYLRHTTEKSIRIVNDSVVLFNNNNLPTNNVVCGFCDKTLTLER